MSNWQCPICGHDKFIEVKSDDVVTTVNSTHEGHISGEETSQLVLGSECCGCTVMFGDPEKFNKSVIPTLNGKEL